MTAGGGWVPAGGAGGGLGWWARAVAPEKSSKEMTSERVLTEQRETSARQRGNSPGKEKGKVKPPSTLWELQASSCETPRRQRRWGWGMRGLNAAPRSLECFGVGDWWMLAHAAQTPASRMQDSLPQACGGCYKMALSSQFPLGVTSAKGNHCTPGDTPFLGCPASCDGSPQG